MEKDLEKLSKTELIALLQQQQVTKQALEEKRQDLEKQLGQAQEISDQKQAVLEQTKEDLEQKQENVAYLKDQVALLKRLLYGQKRERFTSKNNQIPLPFAPDQAEQVHQEEILAEKVVSVRKKVKKKHPGRAKLPEHLPVKEIEIHPEGDLSEMVCIGKEITEELECIPEQYFINRYIRYKYAPKSKEGSHRIAPFN